jgi:hypothetical protein
MNKAEHDTEMIGERLRGYRVVAPTPELKARVLCAAREAWKAAPADDIPWTAPILRLAASLIVAAIPVVLAHTTDSSPVARSAVPERESAAVQETADLWAMTGRAQFASLHRRTAAMPNADAADLLARHLRALAAELLDDRPNGG